MCAPVLELVVSEHKQIIIMLLQWMIVNLIASANRPITQANSLSCPGITKGGVRKSVCLRLSYSNNILIHANTSSPR